MNNLICDSISVNINEARILNGVSFILEPGSIVGLIGPNGSGKTTLLNVISGIQRPSGGRVKFGETLLTNQTRHALGQFGVFRSFQDGRLFESLTAEENLSVAFRPSPDERLSSALVPIIQKDPRVNERKMAVATTLRTVGIELERDRCASDMSYGIRKRTILGQANIANSVVCLLDEPLAGIDPGMRGKMISLVAALRDRNRVVLFVEHDFDAVRDLADRVLLMDRGRLVSDGPVEETLASQTVIDAYL